MRHNKILSGPSRKNDPQKIEGTATVEMGAGLLVTANGQTIALHGIAGARTPLIISDVNLLAGMDIRDNTPVGDTVTAYIAEDDVDYNVMVTAGAIVTGDKLASAGNGMLRKATDQDEVIAYARETVTLAQNDLVTVRKI